MNGDTPDGKLIVTPQKYDKETETFVDDLPDFRYSRLRSHLIICTPNVNHTLLTVDCRALLKSLVTFAYHASFTVATFRWVPTTGTPYIMTAAGVLHAAGITDATKGPVYAPKIDTDADLYSMGINDLLIPSDGGELQISQGSINTFDIYYDYILYSEKL